VILAVDPGLLHFGWALVEPRTARVADLGVLVNQNDNTLDVSTDRARRAARLYAQLDELAGSASTIIGEAALFHGAKAAIASLSLAWGAVSSVAQRRSLPLAEVRPKAWQQAVVPGMKKLDYARVERELHGLIGTHPAFVALKPSLREHALDATSIGVYAALDHPVTWVLRKATG